MNIKKIIATLFVTFIVSAAAIGTVGASEGDGAYVGNEPSNTVVIEPQPNISNNVTPDVIDTLPFTGGDVVVLSIIGGVAIVAGVVLLAKRASR